MSRPDPIEYAERLYAAICGANFSPISFLAFGNAVKEGVELRRMPRMAAEPFMRVVGEMLDLEEEAADDNIIEADLFEQPDRAASEPVVPPEAPGIAQAPAGAAEPQIDEPAQQEPAEHASGSER